MTKHVSTKRALVLSLLSMLLCVSMLIGSTYAWFTDTATTAVNKIQAGTLDVALEMSTDGGKTWENAEGKTLNFMTAGNRAEILWEPGCTYALPLLRVVNKGNLSLKYEVVITGINGDAKLNKAIEWTITGAEAGYLLANGTQEIVISGHMKEDAGNEYQGLSIDGIAITVYATQYSYEKDSNDEKYDTEASFLYKDAEGNVLIGTADELVYFAKTVNVDGETYAGKTVKLTADIDLGGKKWNALVAKGAFTFDGNGKTISNFVVAGEKNVGFFGVSTNCTIKNLTVKGATVTGINHVAAIAGDALCATIDGCKVYDSTITTLVKNNDDGDKAGAIAGYLSAESNASVTNCVVENCTVRGYRDIGGLVGYANAAAVVTGNTVTKVTLINDRTNNYKNYTADAEYDVNGIVGEYNNNSLDASNTYSEVTISKVIPAASQAELETAIDAEGEKILNLGSGIYTLYNVNNSKTKNTTLTIEGSGKDSTTFTAGDLTVTDANGEGSSDYSYENSEVIFRNMTINVGTGNYKGFVRAKSLYFENCKIVGRGSYWGVGDVVFKNCEFEDNAGDYNLWTYSGASFTFDGCTFKSSSGKFVNAYKEAHTEITELTFKNCKFIAGTENKPAVCIKGYLDQAWDVVFTDCELVNCKTDATTGSNYYLFDQGIVADTTVTINNSVVWENGAKK